MGVVVVTDSIEVALRAGPDIVDITGELSRVLARSGVRQGAMLLAVAGSTGSLTTMEYEPGVVEDLKRAINELAPPNRDYAHELAWHDGNGHSHVQAALLGPSLNIPVRGGRLKLGTWQQAVLINHDNKSRRRTVEVTVIGDNQD